MFSTADASATAKVASGAFNVAVELNTGVMKCYKLRQDAKEYAAGLRSTEATPTKNTAHVNVKY